MGFEDMFDKSKKEEKRLKTERKKKDKLWQKKLAREMSYVDCASTLELCKTEFDTIIKLERMRYRERMEKGLDPKNQKARMVNAAKGRRIIDEAIAELEDNRYTEDLNTAMNLMCLALRQLNRVSDSVPQVSRRFYQQAGKLFDSEQDCLAELDKLEVPSEVDSLVSGSFVDNLIAGDNYDTCLRKKLEGDRKINSTTAAQYGAMLDELEDSGRGEGGSLTDDDFKAAKKMLDL